MDGWKPTLIQSFPGSLICLHSHSYFSGKRIENATRDFFWVGVKEEHMASWKLVFQPLSKGGLGLGNNLSRNKALVRGCVRLNSQRVFVNDLI